jgi:phosphoglycerol transferase MdoB-like AlkP superfamily enzyme
MFLVPEKNLAIAMVINTYSPMLGIRVSRVPSNVLRILLAQPMIPGNEFLSARIIYAVVMLVPLLHLIAVLATFRRIRHWRTSGQHPTQTHMVLFIALPPIWNALIAYILLILLPRAFDASLGTIILFQPDVGWIAILSGIFAIVWGLLRTGIVISVLRQVAKKPEIV